MTRSQLQVSEEINAKEVSVALFRTTDELRNRISQACHHIVEEGISSDVSSDETPCLFRLVLSTQTAYSAPIAGIVSEYLADTLKITQEIKSNIHTCLHEAIANAVIHGNLELSTPEGDVSNFDAFYADISRQLHDPAFAYRPVVLEVRMQSNSLIFSVHDQGKGFNFRKALENTKAKVSTNGIFLMHTLGANVSYRNEGRSLTINFQLGSMNKEGALQTAGVTIGEQVLSSRILIVDDTEFNQILISEILRGRGFSDIHFAVDGKDGLEKTLSLKPDIVLLDLLMPVLDGFEYCKEIRKIERLKNLPVLVQTGISSPEHRNRAFAAGASDLITKPVNAEELIARCTIHLERRFLLDDLEAYKERISHEMNEAKAAQLTLMPSEIMLEKLFRSYNVRIDGYLQASSEMGGDFWGAAPIDSDRVCLYICDFSGHGITAALNTFRIHTIIHDLIRRAEIKPAAFLKELNELLFPLIRRDQFCTMFYGIIDIKSARLDYAAAASPSPLVWKNAAKEFILLDGSGPPLGSVKHAEYRPQSMPFDEGDLLMLYSDVLLESCDASGQFISENRLSSWAKDVLLSGWPPGTSREKALVTGIAERFFGATGHILEDDLTIAVYGR